MLIETFPTMFFKWSRLMEAWFASLFVPSFIQTGRPGRTNINDVVSHFNYIKALIGAEHACIGGDYNGVSSLPEGLGDVSTYPDLIAALILDGWTEAELRGILQENILRAWG